MKLSEPLPAGDVSEEVSELIETLLAAEQRLVELTAGEVDTVAGQDGRTFLLRRAQEQLRISEAEKQAAILNALPAHIALLDARGVIVSVNEAWRQFADANVLHGPPHAVGLNYLTICDRARGQNSSEAHQVADGIRDVLSGRANAFSIEYPCHAPKENRWFQLMVTPLANDRSNGAVVMHLNITARRRAADALNELARKTERQERILNSALSSMSDFAQIYDRDGRLLFVNQPLLDLWGRTLEEVVGRNFLELGYPAELAARLQRQIVEVFETSQRITDETPYVSPTGVDGVYEYIFSPIFADDHTVDFVVGNSRDISERKRADAESSEREERLRAALSASGTGTFRWDIRTNELNWDHSLDALFGLPPGKTVRSLEVFIAAVHPDDRAGVIERCERCARDGADFAMELRVVWPDGSVHWLDDRGKTSHDAAGRPLHMTGACVDITERKRGEETLRENEERFRGMFTAAATGIATSTPQGRFLQANAAYCRMLGYTEAELQERDFASLTHPDDLMLNLELRDEMLAGKRPNFVMEKRYLRKDGEIVWTRHSVSAVRSSEGEVATFIVVAEDITERRWAEARLRRFVDSNAQGVFFWNPKGGISESNDAFLKITGYTRDDLEAGRIDWLKMTPPEFATLDRRAIKELTTTGTCSPYEKEYLRKDGSRVPILLGAAMFEDDPGEGVCFVLDITERKRASAQLMESEERLTLATESAQVGIWEWDVLTNALSWDAQMYALYGIRPGEFSGAYDAWQKGLHPDDRRRCETEIEAAVEGAGGFHSEFRVVWPNGETRDIEAHGIMHRAADGSAARMVGVNWDITQRKQAEHKVGEQANLLNLTHDAIMVRDMDDRIQFWSHGAELLYGWTAAEACGQLSGDFLHHEAQADVLAAKRTFLTEGLWSGECRHTTKEGKTVIVRSRWTLVRDEHGQPKSKFVINTDVTEQKKIEEQFLRAQRLESIGTLASGVAHDLNNILVPIMMVAPLLRGEMTREEREKFLDIVETSAQRGADIIKQVLTFARGADGDRILLQPIFLLEEVSKIASQTFPKSIVVRTSYEEDTHLIEADSTQLHQILLNLCINARDAMPDGGELCLGVHNFEVDQHYAGMTPGSAAGPHVMFEVTDTGSGIPPEVIAKIFDPFFTTKSADRGTGLGLSTVSGIVKSHGGFINVSSQPGHTSFKVFLPAQTVLPPSSALHDEAMVPRGRGETVLLVDDEPSIREVAEFILTDHGYKVMVAEDGPGALAVFARHVGVIAVVVTDLAMPGMDGLMLVRTLRRIEPKVKILISTGGAAESNAAEISGLRVDGFLHKPYTARNLLLKLSHVLHSTVGDAV